MSLSRWLARGEWRFLALAAVLGAAGCGLGSSTGTVTGKVTYKGNVVKGGTVTFVSAPGKPSASVVIQEDGSYEIPSIATGPVKICVDTSGLRPRAKGAGGPPPAKSYGPPPGSDGPGGYRVTPSEDGSKNYVAIPENYADAEKSGLTYTVTGGKQEHNISLQ